MLKFKDKSGNTKFLLRDFDTVPQDADKIMLQEVQKAVEEEEKQSVEDGPNAKDT